MEGLEFTVIKTKEQYNAYCEKLRELIVQNMEHDSSDLQDRIDLLTLLIETWDEEHNTLDDLDPIQLLNSLMKDHRIKSVELARILGVSASLVSSILNYRRGLSKENVRRLSAHFKLSQDAFNRPYKLVSPTSGRPVSGRKVAKSVS